MAFKARRAVEGPVRCWDLLPADSSPHNGSEQVPSRLALHRSNHPSAAWGILIITNDKFYIKDMCACFIYIVQCYDILNMYFMPFNINSTLIFFLIEKFQIGFLNPVTRDTCFKSARIMLVNLTAKHPKLISKILEWLNISSNCGKVFYR